ncbi:hypothetical protein C8R47DRAFT_1227529 [Mycena vitilis]|nr:hypothetical protein C8R47DRAFT_1227529 [Mycena vitilis]
MEDSEPQVECADGYKPFLIRDMQGDPDQVMVLRARERAKPKGPPMACTWCKVDDVRLFRCRDCFVGLAACLRCLLVAHLEWPLHAPEEWLGNYWKRMSLTDIGYVYRRGHDGLDCPNPAEVELQKLPGLHGEVEIWVQDCLCDAEVE